MKKVIVVLLVLGFLLLMSGCVPKTLAVKGKAMKPTINDGDFILIDKNFGELKRGDIIAFLYPKDKSAWFVQRIIALPEEKVEIREGRVFINGELLEEPYVQPNFNQKEQWFPERVVPENHYYVLGDNRDNSSDSRYWGTVSKDLITGIYVSTYWKADSK
jgi:signal peptidase I